MERSSGEPKHSQTQKGLSIDKVPYSKAVKLSLSAAQEYFDSSSNLSDSCMDLARLELHSFNSYFKITILF